MKVMILAAGYGRRLLPLTEVTPKPLLEVNGKSLIQRNIETLISSGFDEFVINISYLGQMIKEHVSHTFPGIKISFSEEVEPLGTGGGVSAALDILGKDTFVLINSDICHDINIKNLSSDTESAHLIGVKNPDHNSDGDFSLDGDRLIIKEGKNDFTWTGISVINPTIFSNFRDQEGPFDIWKSVMTKPIQNKTVTAEISHSNWIDTGTFERLELANKIYKDEN
ncbi:nucleotidyltransferase family protein [Gammaproteobacteria bacterium]|nr:nucleotidyltransferase family protein [Gammaproteobacteria bacterium]